MASLFNLSSRYIIAFSYDRSKLKFNELANKKESPWELEEQDDQEKDIYNYIDASFLNKGNILTCETNKAIACNYIRHFENRKYIYIQDDDEINFNINDFHLLLFQSGIGFLWYEPAFRSKNLTDTQLINFNYYFKELARNENANCIYIESKPRDIIPGEDCPKTSKILKNNKVIDREKFSFGGWISEILFELNCNVIFYPFRKSAVQGKALPDKAILFHHLSTTNDKEIVDYAYYLTRGYKQSYKRPSDVDKLMMHPFDNVYFFATSEGCGYYAVSNADNKAFFNDPSKVMGDYFELFIMLLYQSYTLVLCSEKIANGLSANSEDYKKYSAETIEELENINIDLNVFLAKSVYSSVSHVQHQNDFYEYVSSTLRIKENIESVSAGIEALRNLENNLMEEEKEKQQRSLEVGVTLISILAIFSAFNDTNDFINNYLPYIWEGSLISIISNGFILLITLIVLFLAIKFAIARFVYTMNNRKRNKKK